jgi:glycosyltransferase involved in cell wall biosynthesis
MIPVSVLVCVKNEEARLGRCLDALNDFDDVVVIDSYSTDGTRDIARLYANVRIVSFLWNGCYPKKYQWSLDRAETRYRQVLFVDADEIVTPELCAEISRCDWMYDGYFIKGRPVWNERPLRYGLWNNKLALIDKEKFLFPAIDDLDLPGGNEIEGHYQPIAKGGARIGQMHMPMLHDCADNWQERHDRYACWEAGMMLRNAFPRDPVPRRELMKRIFRALPCRGILMFIYGYVARLGIFDGRAGLDYALAKGRYYHAISRAKKMMETAI